jgi:SAM-dependent methyltransferase
MEPVEYQLMDQAEDGMWWYRALHARILDALRGTSGRVLDAGCGTGGLLARLRANSALDLYGLEYEATAAHRAASKSGAAVVQGSVNTLPFADASFAAVISADVLCHTAVDPQAALAEFHRVLAPGGLLVLNLPAFQWMMSAHDIQVHTARRTTTAALARDLAAAGFAQPRPRYWNSLLFPLMVLQRKVISRPGKAALAKAALRKSDANGGETVSDVAAFPPLLDATFHALTALERRLPIPFPAGGSVLATARKPPA